VCVRIGANNLDRAVTTGPRDVKLDVAELGQKMPLIVAIAAIGSIVGIKLLEITIDRRGDLAFNDFLKRLPAKRAITLAPIQAARLHCLHDFKSHR
jgi:hypothetical protein